MAANSTTTTYMSLVLPTPGGDLNAWGTDLNTSLALLDVHDHSSGKGTQITQAGINITGSLSFNSKAITSLLTLTFTDPGTSVTAVDTVYVKSNNLWFTDGNGNQIQLTASGSVAGTAGSITGFGAGDSIVLTHATGALAFNSNSGTSNMLLFGQEFSVPTSGGKFSFGQTTSTTVYMDYNAGLTAFRFNNGGTGNANLFANSLYLDATHQLGLTTATDTFNFNTATVGAANLLFTRAKFQDPAPGSNVVTVLAPSGLAASYTATWPTAVPASTLPMSMSSAGAMSVGQITAAQITSGTITGTQLASNNNLPGKNVQVNGQNIVASANPSSNGLVLIRGFLQATSSANSLSSATTIAGEGFSLAFSGGGSGTITITFTNAFSESPAVIVVDDVATSLQVTASSVNSASFVISLRPGSTWGSVGTRNIFFIAIAQRT